MRRGRLGMFRGLVPRSKFAWFLLLASVAASVIAYNSANPTFTFAVGGLQGWWLRSLLDVMREDERP